MISNLIHILPKYTKVSLTSLFRANSLILLNSGYLRYSKYSTAQIDLTFRYFYAFGHLEGILRLVWIILLHFLFQQSMLNWKSDHFARSLRQLGYLLDKIFNHLLITIYSLRNLTLSEVKLFSTNKVDRIADISYEACFKSSNYYIIRALNKYNQTLHLILDFLIGLDIKRFYRDIV